MSQTTEWDAYLDDTEKRAAEKGGGGDFLHLESGQTVEVVFMSPGFPYRDAKWGKDRELFVVFDIANKAVKVLDMSTFFVGSWIKTIREYGPQYRYRITRTGSGAKDTRYGIVPVKDGTVSNEKWAQLQAMERPALSSIVARKEGVEPEPADAASAEPAPIDDKDLPF